MNSLEEQAADDVIVKCLAILSEHFETAQIFVTAVDQDQCTTNSHTAGFGNWYARRGQINDWVTREDTKTSETAS